MLSQIRPALSRGLAPVAGRLVRAGVTPDAITIVGTAGVVGGAIGFYPRGSFLIGTLVITAFVFNDMLDGAVARARGTVGRPWGAFLDSTLDRFGDAAIFGSLALWFSWGGHSRLMEGVSIYVLCAGFVTSYVKARAEGLGLRCDVGLVERAERLLGILVLTGFNGILDLPVLTVIALWALAAGTTITVVQRYVEVHRQAAMATP